MRLILFIMLSWIAYSLDPNQEYIPNTVLIGFMVVWAFIGDISDLIKNFKIGDK